MTRRRRALTALLPALLVAALAPAAVSSADPTTYAKGSFLGIDGLTYASAPDIVEAQGGNLFYGPDFDTACGYGAGAVAPMRRMSKLAKLIEKTGRRVIWTGAPSKTSVLYDQLATAEMPHGNCDAMGLRGQAQMIDRYQDPSYLPIRKPLSESKHQVYWRTDPHWTTVGGSIWARAIAAKLDPRLGRQQRYTYGSETQVGLFNRMLGIDTPETLEMATPRKRVRSKTSRHSVEQWAGYPVSVSDYSWDSKPAERTWPGRTLIFGDSFTFYALPNLLPVFRHARFMWIAAVDIEDVLKAIKDSDTVVFEVYQTFMPLGTVLTTRTFRKQVRDVLRRDLPH